MSERPLAEVDIVQEGKGEFVTSWIPSLIFTTWRAVFSISGLRGL